MGGELKVGGAGAVKPGGMVDGESPQTGPAKAPSHGPSKHAVAGAGEGPPARSASPMAEKSAEMRARTSSFSMPAGAKPTVRAPQASLRRAVSMPNLGAADGAGPPASEGSTVGKAKPATQTGAAESVAGTSTSSVGEAGKDHTIAKTGETDALAAAVIPASPRLKLSARSLSSRGGGLKAFLSKAEGKVKPAISKASPKIQAFTARATKEFDSSRLVFNAVAGKGGQPGLGERSVSLAKNVAENAAPMAARSLEVGKALAALGTAVLTLNPAAMGVALKSAKALKPTAKDLEMAKDLKGSVTDFHQQFGEYKEMMAQVKSQRSAATPAA
jgi:hypothetical protein